MNLFLNPRDARLLGRYEHTNGGKGHGLSFACVCILLPPNLNKRVKLEKITMKIEQNPMCSLIMRDSLLERRKAW